MTSASFRKGAQPEKQSTPCPGGDGAQGNTGPQPAPTNPCETSTYSCRKFPVTWAFAFRTLAKNRARTAVTIVGIALAAALLTAVLVSANSVVAFLHDEEAATQGAWHARVTTNDAEKIEAARTNSHISALSVTTNVGFAAPAHQDDDEALAFDYLFVQSIDSNFDTTCALPLSSGRMPENSHEIVLYSIYDESTTLSDEPCELGTTITVDLGTISTEPVDDNPNALATENLSEVEGSSEAEDLGAVEGSSEADSAETASSDETASSENAIEADNTAASDLAAPSASTEPTPAEEGAAETGAASTTGRLTSTFTPSGLSQTYTVVGFYQSDNTISYTTLGTKGFTFADAQTQTAYDAKGESPMKLVYFSTTGLSSDDDIRSFARETFGVSDDQVELHSNILRFSGIGNDQSIWGTLTTIVAILAIVIVTASASLIYNSFAISVAERIRQFGLLSSAGASRKQIRAMVRHEAFLLALAGIPLGLIVGIGGSFAVLTALSPALSKVIGGSGATTFGMHVNAQCLLIAAALTLVAVAISAWVPARRAARVSAIDALRNTQNIKASYRERRRATRDGAASGVVDSVVDSVADDVGAPDSTSAASSRNHPERTLEPDESSALWKPQGFALGARMLGVPAMLAQKSARRSGAKGRVATASLLLAMVLIVTAGALGLYLNTAISVTSKVVPCDVLLTVFFDNEETTPADDANATSAENATEETDTAGNPNSTNGSAVSGASGATASPDETAPSNAAPKANNAENEGNATGSDADNNPATASSQGIPLSDLSSLYQSLQTTTGAEGAGSCVQLNVPVSIPGDMAGEGFALLESGGSVTQADGTVDAQINLAFVDDESYREYLASQGLDIRKYTDASHPLAVANREAYGNNGKSYQIMPVFTRTGFIDLYAYRQHDGVSLHTREYPIETGKLGVNYLGDETSFEESATSREDGASVVAELEIGALVDEIPPVLGNPYGVYAIMPLSFAGLFGLTENTTGEQSVCQTPDRNTSLSFLAAFNSEQHAKTTEDIMSQIGQTEYGFSVYDASESQEMSRLVVVVFETFALCFAAILTLIAVTNVFNTLVSGFSLRRREFAVLKSVGMDNRAFNRMIAWECLRYGGRALMGGLAVSALISYLMYLALGESIDGLAFTLPWGSIAAAALVILAATAASTAYGLRRANTNSVVEALRM